MTQTSESDNKDAISVILGKWQCGGIYCMAPPGCECVVTKSENTNVSNQNPADLSPSKKDLL